MAKDKKNKSGLSIQEMNFCLEYIKNNGNGTKAFLKAYPNTKNENSAAASASEYLRKPKIQEYIKERRNKVEENAGLSKLLIVLEHKEIMENKKNSPLIRIEAMKAIRKMLGYDEPEKFDHTTQGKPLHNLSDVELTEMLRKLSKLIPE